MAQVYTPVFDGHFCTTRLFDGFQVWSVRVIVRNIRDRTPEVFGIGESPSEALEHAIAEYQDTYHTPITEGGE